MVAPLLTVAVRDRPSPPRQVRPGERQQAYALVESLDRDLADTRALLGETSAALNAAPPAAPAGSAEATMASMVTVLDTHLNAFQWLGAQGGKLESALAQARRHLLSYHVT